MPETGSRIMKLSGKRDLILAAAILLIAAALFGFNYISHKKPAVTAQITVDGKVVEKMCIRDRNMSIETYGPHV